MKPKLRLGLCCVHKPREKRQPRCGRAGWECTANASTLAESRSILIPSIVHGFVTSYDCHFLWRRRKHFRLHRWCGPCKRGQLLVQTPNYSLILQLVVPSLNKAFADSFWNGDCRCVCVSKCISQTDRKVVWVQIILLAYLDQDYPTGFYYRPEKEPDKIVWRLLSHCQTAGLDPVRSRDLGFSLNLLRIFVPEEY